MGVARLTLYNTVQSRDMTGQTLACEHATPRNIRINGLNLHLLETGPPDAAPVCFLHGGAAHAHWFDRVIPALAARFHVVSLDQRGHGQSAWANPPAYATQDFAADVRALMDHFGWPRMALVGHSMGGHNSMAFAAWHPDRVSALVVVDSRPQLPPDRIDRMRERGQRPPRLHATEDAAVRSFRLLPKETTADAALLEHLARAGLIHDNGGYRYRFDPACYANRQPVDCWPLVSRITAPSLVVRGELSPILPADMAARLGASIPRAEVVEIKGAYHHLTLDAPDAFARVLERFLRSVI
jgi:pimeloyl-ACP methyl ester carboxylesterase